MGKQNAKNESQPIHPCAEVSPREKAFLLQGDRKIHIIAQSASRYSLLFKYFKDHPPIDPEKPVNLFIQDKEQAIEIGPCRILMNAGKNEDTGRLVSFQDLYDFHQVLQQKKLVKLQAGFQDLPLLLAIKNEIKPEFKGYVADLKYDLQVYKNLFDNLDSKYHAEPEEAKNSIQETIIRTEGPSFRRFFEDKLDELKSIVDDFTWKEHQCHGYYFRNQLWGLIHCSPFTARATQKPRGYAGDFGLMQMIYLNNYQGDSTYSKLTHKHAVEHAATQSVRHRIKLIAQLLDNHKNSSPLLSRGKIKVLSVGCGPAFELKNILKSPRDCLNYHFTLFDQDNAALLRASELIDKIGNRFNSVPEVEYIQGSVRSMLFSRKFEQKWGQYHFIYSLGLFDYLSSRVAKAVLDRLFRILKPGGELVVGNFHVSNPSKYYMAYWGGWHLILRTEENFKSLFQHTPSGKCSVLYDNTGIQMFLRIKKNVKGA